MAIGIALLVGACATASKDVEPVYAPVEPYAALSCEQLHAQAGRTDDEIKAISARIDSPSTGDRLALGVGVVFWPALFMVDGNGSEQDKLAILKGQKISIDDALLDRDCPPELPKLRAQADAESDLNRQ